MTRSRVNKIPGLKEEKKVVKPAQAEPVRVRMSYEERLETQGSGVSKKPKYYGEKPLRKVVAEHADKKVETKVGHLTQSGLVNDAQSIEKSKASQKAKAIYTNGEKKRILRERNEERQRNAMETQFNDEVAATWGEEEGEFNTRAEKEMHEKRVEAGKKAAVTRQANREAKDLAYEQWYCETAFGVKDEKTK